MTTFNNMDITAPDNEDADYPADVTDAFQKIDEHDHTSGKGVQVPTAGIEDGAITGAKLDSGIVDDSTIEIDSSTLQVKDGGIDTAQLADGSVETAKIADDAVTTEKMAINYALSSLIINDSISGTSFSSFENGSGTDVEVSITVAGDRDLELSLVSIGGEPTIDPAEVQIQNSSGTVIFDFSFYDTGSTTDYSAGRLRTNTITLEYPPGIFKTIIPAASLSSGAKTFKFRGKTFGGISPSAFIQGAKIMAREL